MRIGFGQCIQIGSFVQKALISFFAIPIVFALLMDKGALFHSLVASPINEWKRSCMDTMMHVQRLRYMYREYMHLFLHMSHACTCLYACTSCTCILISAHASLWIQMMGTYWTLSASLSKLGSVGMPMQLYRSSMQLYRSSMLDSGAWIAVLYMDQMKQNDRILYY